jgi:hypothetical protein
LRSVAISSWRRDLTDDEPAGQAIDSKPRVETGTPSDRQPSSLLGGLENLVLHRRHDLHF